MAQSNSRFSLDLDEIERQLRQPSTSGPTREPTKDPLAELARIVGQDDPFRSLLASESTPVRREPQLYAVPSAPYASAAEAGPLHRSFEEVLRESPEAAPDHRTPAQQIDAAAARYITEDETYPEAVRDLRRIEKSRSRKGVLAVGSILGVAVIGVAAALATRSGPTLAGRGEPPIIQAEREPLKVRPENPGGVDIPDQNKQIYERGAQDGQTKVVTREEQPVDVQQAARSLPPPPPATAIAGAPLALVPPAPPPSIGTPVANQSAAAALGEPRRVRTVTVRPDGSMIHSDASAGPAPAAPAASAPAAAPTTGSTQAAQRPRAEARTPTPAASPPTPATSPPTPAQRQVPAPARPQAAAPAQPPAPVTASAAQPARPQRTAAIAPPAEPAQTGAAATFSVQLGVGSSEGEARGLVSSLRQKYGADLSGRAPAVRKAEVNGKALYRVRVEAMTREEADGLCTRLRSSGGQCFVARN